MIRGIGVDSVEISRFSGWGDYSQKKLLRIFSKQEIAYCLKQKNKSAERFAARFAAREAFFKAFSSAFPTLRIPFLTLCRYVAVEKINERPILYVDWDRLVSEHDKSFVCHLSLTHTKTVATAFVVLEIRDPL